MSLMLKDPAAALDYEIDWGEDYLDEDYLASSSWTIAPDEPGGLSLVSDGHDFTRATCTVSGGEVGHLYRLTNVVRTDSGRTDSRSLVIRVEAR